MKCPTCGRRPSERFGLVEKATGYEGLGRYSERHTCPDRLHAEADRVGEMREALRVMVDAGWNRDHGYGDDPACEKAVIEERERCARIAEEWDISENGAEIAAAIRASAESNVSNQTKEPQ